MIKINFYDSCNDKKIIIVAMIRKKDES